MRSGAKRGSTACSWITRHFFITLAAGRVPRSRRVADELDGADCSRSPFQVVFSLARSYCDFQVSHRFI